MNTYEEKLQNEINDIQSEIERQQMWLRGNSSNLKAIEDLKWLMPERRMLTNQLEEHKSRKEILKLNKTLVKVTICALTLNTAIATLALVFNYFS